MECGDTLIEGVTPIGRGGVKKVAEATYRIFHFVERNRGFMFRDSAIRVLQDLDSTLSIFGISGLFLHCSLELKKCDHQGEIAFSGLTS